MLSEAHDDRATSAARDQVGSQVELMSVATLLDGDTVTHPEGRVYFYRLQAGRVTVTKSVLIVEVTSRAPPATLTLSGDS